MADARKATTADAAAVARALASAFSRDPLFTWFLGPNGDPERRLTPLFAALTKRSLSKLDHEIYVSDDGDGAAVWHGVDRWKVPTGDLVRSAPAMVRSFGRRTGVVLKVLSAMEKVHPTEPHYYLEFLGTRFERQGTGIGSAVIAPMLERCDTEGLPAYLENSNPRNEAFYARHGFTLRKEIALPPGTPPLLPMWREPRTA